MAKRKHIYDENDIEVTVKFVDPRSPEDAAEREDRITAILTENAINIVRKGLNK